MPFWRAVLGYEPRPDSPDEDLVDPRDRGPGVLVRGDGGAARRRRRRDPHRGLGSDAEAEARVAAALAAGGRMVRDEFAPAWWTLADAAGNEADIATLQQRD